MARENYARCLANTLVYEGSWSNHPQDPGGPTMRGVIQVRYDEYRRKWGKPKQSVRLITEEELQEIYHDGYAKPVGFDAWPKGPDQIVFDIGVNSGPARGLAIMAEVMKAASKSPAVLASIAANSNDKVALVKAACARRARFYRGIRTFATFGKGWLRRNAGMEAIAVKMCLEAAGSVAPNAALRAERDQAAKAETKAKTATATTAGSGTAATTGTAATDPTSWDWWQWLGAGALALVLLLVLAAAIWAWVKHRERVKAYAAVLAGQAETTLAAVIAGLRSRVDELEEAV